MPKPDKLIFITLFFSIFATITGVGIVVPLLPVYASSLGAGGLHIGLIFGAFSLSRVLFLPYFGRLSDRIGRKPLIVPGLMAYTLVSAAFLISENVNTFIAIRLIQGVASAMLLPVIQAYVGDITPQGREGFVMGVFNTSVFCGLSLGPVLGGFIHDRFSLDAAFLSMGALSFFGFLLSLFLLPPARDERAVQRQRPPARWRRLIRNRDIAGVFFFRFAYTLCIGVIWGFLPVLAAAQFSLSSAAIGFLVMLGILISGIVQVPMGWMADRLNKTVLVIAGGIGVSCAVLSYVWAESFADMVLASVLFGLSGGVCMPALMAAVVIIGDRAEAMGSVMALLTAGHSLGMFVGAMLAGLMMDLVSLRAVFPVGAILMALGTAAFAASRRRPKSALRSPLAAPVGDGGCGFYDDPIGLNPPAEKAGKR